jgi:quercetin dioxygenase-like cupin family protein
MSAFDDLEGIAPIELFSGFAARAIHGERLTLAVVEIDPDAELPEHHHANEQFGIVLTGSLVLRVGDEERELGPGSTWRIPSDVPHAGRGGPDGAVVIDVFSPPREDWQALESRPSQSPRWP